MRNSFLDETITFGSIDGGEPSCRSVGSGTNLAKLSSMVPTAWKRSAKSFILMKSLSGDSTESK